MSIVHLPWRASKKGTAESWTRDFLERTRLFAVVAIRFYSSHYWASWALAGTDTE